MRPTSLAQLTRLLGAHDAATLDHSWRVSRLSRALAVHIGLPGSRVRAASLAGLLHDVGKVAVPTAILAKPSPLTAVESAVMADHAWIGAGFVERLVPADVVHAVAHHHDRAGDGALPWMTRLVSVADTYDALVSDRPYRRACSPLQACGELRRAAGTQLDGEMVEALIACGGSGGRAVSDLVA